MTTYTLHKSGYKSFNRRLRAKYITALGVVKAINPRYLHGGIEAKNSLILFLEDDIKWITKGLKNIHRRHYFSAYKYPSFKAMRNVFKKKYAIK